MPAELRTTLLVVFALLGIACDYSAESLHVMSPSKYAANGADGMAHDWARKSWPEQFMLKPSQRRGALLFFWKAGTPPYFLHVETMGTKTNATSSLDLQLTMPKN